MRRFLRTSLRAQGYQVLQAVTGQEAIARVTASRPYVVLFDLGLLDLDALQVLRRTEPGGWYRLCLPEED